MSFILNLKTILKAAIYKNAFSPIVRDFYRFYLGPKIISPTTINPFTQKNISENERIHSLHNAMYWLAQSQDKMRDNGSGTFSLSQGWTSSYPETTGYIIPTLISYGLNFNQPQFIERGIKAADWLISIQKDSGGWQGGYLDENNNEVVFNTGQIIRGMFETYHFTKKEIYLSSAIRACHWLCDIQNPAGYWDKFAFLNSIRCYDSYVDYPLLLIYQLTGIEKFKECAIKNLNWIIQHKQMENGWFEDADNTINKNDQPILHTIAYTIEGLLDSGIFLADEKLISAAQKSADKLLEIFNKQKYLRGRYDRNWKPTVKYIIPTGCAQTAIIWLKLYLHTKNIQYLNAALKMNDLLIFLQYNSSNKNIHGALPGSFPIGEEYQNYLLPNWTTKYFADSLMLEKQCLTQLNIIHSDKTTTSDN